jgi:hypothetical protein
VVEAYLGAPPEEVEAQLHGVAEGEAPAGAHRKEDTP